MTKGGKLVWGATGQSSSQLVTVLLGGLQVTSTNAQPDPSLQLYVTFTPLVTPATMLSPSFGKCGVYFTSPDGTNKNWGCGLWGDLATSGTVNTQNAATGGCSANCVTVASGSNFDATNWSSFGQGELAITINGVMYTVNTVVSATVLSLNSAPGTQTGVSYIVHQPNTGTAALCTASSTTVVTTTIYNTLTPSGCPTPTTSTQYWVGAITASNTQAYGRIQGNVPCPNTGQGSWLTAAPLANFAAWPPSTVTVVGDQGDGCYAQYMEVSYTTTDPFIPIISAISNCDAPGTTCLIDIPTVPSGMNALIWENTSNSGAPVLTPTDGGDTFSKVGTCPTVTGGAVNWSSCLYLGTITAGTTRITCNYTALNKDGCDIIIYKGGAASADTSCYDSTVTSSTPYTGCTTSTTSAANEFWVSTGFNQLGFTTGNGWNAPLIYPQSSWISLGSGIVNGTGAVTPQAFMYQLVTSTGTCTPSGTTIASGSNHIFSSCVAIK